MTRNWHMSIVTVAIVAIIIISFLLSMETYLLVYQSLANRITNYERSRIGLLLREQFGQTGGLLPLSEHEQKANEHLMAQKWLEYEQGERNESGFKPRQQFYQVREQITRSPIYKLLRAMPKGGALHVRDMALCSTDYLIEQTYREHLWACATGPNHNYERLLFSRDKPTSDADSCSWALLRQRRKIMGAAAVDQKLRERLTMQPTAQPTNQQTAWHELHRLTHFVSGLLTYEDVWGEYFYHGLEELFDDGVQYVEVRSSLPPLYNLNGANFSMLDTFTIMMKNINNFRRTHDTFADVKLIYAPLRQASEAVFNYNLDSALMMKSLFPTYLAGFDLTGQETAGPPLREIAHTLIAAQTQIDFYFHAGDTNWYGSNVDENLIDAALLGTKRIGYGYALPKHPEVMKMMYHKNIAVEMSPISDQMLQHLQDFRNHPLAYLLARNYPVVISSDYPSFWQTKPLTHDYYITFVGIAAKTADLRLLKQLVLNSLYYSALDEDEQDEVLAIWMHRWNAWIDKVAIVKIDSLEGSMWHSD